MQAYVGLDIGTLFLKIARMDEDGRVVASFYKPHMGDPIKLLKDELSGYTGSTAVTGTNEQFLKSSLSLKPVNHIQSIIEYVQSRCPGARNIIDIGGNTATYIELTDEGAFKFTNCNSLCAAGTGSFLDEQAARLELGYEDIAEMPLVESPPEIAARCSVFAKTDLIHRQQQGYSKEEMWAGLCRGMVQTCLTTLLKGRELEGMIVPTGGVSLNHHVLHWLRQRYSGQLKTFPDSHLASAIGAVYYAKRENAFVKLRADSLKASFTAERKRRRNPLVLKKSKMPVFEPHDSYTDSNKNDVRYITKFEGRRLEALIGIDIGSTSTKAVLMDRNKRIILDVYRRTLGNPVDATKKLLQGIREWGSRENIDIAFLGAGTTGSGREIIGRVTGADLIMNEITAHTAGAMETDPGIDTIFEIGGQDSKYMFTVNGFIRESNMNYVCAAGTGSFIEEQANKLGLAVEEVGAKVLGISPPFTSDRCTVFMEQDIQVLLKEGYSREEALAATMYSVAQNYITRVVGSKYRKPGRILFLGATAKNPGLVAAFEQLLDVEVVVSPFSHVMGAFGAALQLLRKIEDGEEPAGPPGTGFRGFDFIDAPVSLSEERCRFCTNYCLITTAEIGTGEEKVSWGYLCGRDPADERKKSSREFRLMDKRERLMKSYGGGTAASGAATIGIPMALTTFSNYPLWATFFTELGFSFRSSPVTDSAISLSGVMASGAEFCHPTRVSVGHILSLLEDPSVDFVFVPSLLESFRIEEVTKSWYCPLVIQNPYYSAAALSNHRDAGKLLPVSINFNWPRDNIEKELTAALRDRLGKPASDLMRAWDRAVAAQKDFEEKCQEYGREFLEELEREGKDCIVILGRPYIVYDYGINLNLPKRIAEYGYPVVPLEFIPYDEKTREELKEGYSNLYWAYGQRILNAVEFIRGHPNLYPVCFTSFKCGPDSYVLTYVESSIKDKPLLTLEFDEHNSEGGYITRLEAFFDTIRSNPVKVSSKFEAGMVIKDIFEVGGDEPIYIPSSPDNFVEAYGAVFRRYGFDARVCPPVTEDIYNLGRAYTRGSECSPAVEMVSNFLAVLEESEEKEFNFAMAESTGPCRMGQYSYLYNVIFKHFKDKKINFINAQISVDTSDSINPEIKKLAYRGVVLLDLLQKCLHKTRPYEKERGRTKEAYLRYKNKILRALEKDESLEPVFVEAVGEFKKIEVRGEARPLVGIVGEYFVTTSPFINQNLIEVIEDNGGEAWLVPHSDFVLWYSVKDFQVLHKLKPVDPAGMRRQNATIEFLQDEEHRWIELSGGFLADRSEPTMKEIYDRASRYMHEDVPNETLPTVGRAVLFAERDDADLIINCKPFSCMPGNASEAILQRVKDDYDIPIVSVNYEGTGEANKSVVTMLLNLSSRKGASGSGAP